MTPRETAGAVRRVSWYRLFEQWAAMGIGIGWDDGHYCLTVIVGRHILIIGRHIRRPLGRGPKEEEEK